MNLYLTHAGRLRRHNNSLKFEAVTLPPDEQQDLYSETEALDDATPDLVRGLPVESVDAIYIFGEAIINSKLVNFLNSKKIPVHFFNWFGHHTGTLLPHAEQLCGDLVIRQGEAYRNQQERLLICRNLLKAVFHNIRSVLQYYHRRRGGLDAALASALELEAKLDDQSTPEGLMGLEGNLRRLYYQAWPLWLGKNAEDFRRVYHPPDNPINALLSFLNSLLYAACVSELYRTALYPGISFLHTPQTRRFSLALDLVEPFKPLMVDRLLFRLFDNHMVNDDDFRKHTNGFLLTDEGRRKVLQEWDQDLRKTVHCPVLNRSVSYRQLLRLDCYKLVNHLLEKREYLPYQCEY